MNNHRANAAQSRLGAFMVPRASRKPATAARSNTSYADARRRLACIERTAPPPEPTLNALGSESHAAYKTAAVLMADNIEAPRALRAAGLRR